MIVHFRKVDGTKRHEDNWKCKTGLLLIGMLTKVDNEKNVVLFVRYLWNINVLTKEDQELNIFESK